MVRELKKNTGKSLRQQLNEFIQNESPKGKKLNWEKFFGKVNFNMDPIDYQRKLRDEWE